MRCHGEPPIGGAPDTFRLDSYPDRRTPSETLIGGAGSFAALVAFRAAARTMPPRFPLDDDQIAILQLWAEQADGGMPARGEPRSGNRAPALALRSTGATSWEYSLIAFADVLTGGEASWCTVYAGSGGGDRTPDPAVNSRLLYH